MIPYRDLIGACLLACGVSALSAAAAPMRPPADWTAERDGVSLTGDLSGERVIVQPPEGPAWDIQGWHRHWSVHPSADGQHVLLSNPGAGSMSWAGDPDQIVLTVVAAPGVVTHRFTVSDLMDLDDMQSTASAFIWIDRYHWSEGAWIFQTPDDQGWRLSPDGALIQR